VKRSGYCCRLAKVALRSLNVKSVVFAAIAVWYLWIWCQGFFNPVTNPSLIALIGDFPFVILVIVNV
jgi:hypothetical protein